MYRVIETKGKDEPWWMFDNWQDSIVNEQAVNSSEEAVALMQQWSQTMEKHYQHQREKKGAIAFWNEDEVEYCVPCEEDLQIYHGLMIIDGDGSLYSEGGLRG